MGRAADQQKRRWFADWLRSPASPVADRFTPKMLDLACDGKTFLNGTVHNLWLRFNRGEL